MLQFKDGCNLPVTTGIIQYPHSGVFDTFCEVADFKFSNVYE